MKRVVCSTVGFDLEGLAKKVSDDFKATMKDEGFESFSEMSQCYMWDSQDVKDEIYYMVDSLYGQEYHVTVDDNCNIVPIGDYDIVPYRRFRNMVGKYLKSDTIEEDI